MQPSKLICHRRLRTSFPPFLRILLAVLVASASCLQQHRFRDRRDTRNFAFEMVLAPLVYSDHFENTLSITASQNFLNTLPVLYTNDPKHVSRWLGDHVPTSGHSILGFDVESVPDVPWMKTKPYFRGPATVQLATPYAGLVVHLARSNGKSSMSCGPLIDAVLRDPRIVKAGCAIDQDMLALARKWKGLEARSRLDLGGVGASGNERKGLKTLARDILGITLPKSRRIATSDWSQVPLSPEQIGYAANDAWVAAAVAATLSVHDAETFGAKAVAERLQSQPSLNELSARQWKRTQAKAMISALLMHDSKGSASTAQISTLSPAWKRNAVRELKKVIHENQVELCEIYCLESTGLRTTSNAFNNTTGDA